jgi:flagellar basal body P-ring formation protein FlgA
MTSASMKRIAQLLGCLATLIAGQVNAQAIESLDSIRSAAESYVQAQLPDTRAKYYVTAARLDPRLRLADCTKVLDVFVANNGSVQPRTTIGVRCTDVGGWTIYVPVTIEVEAQVLVLRRPLARRARVEALDVELQTRRLPGISTNFLSDVSTLQGRRLRRALAAGTPLTIDVLDRDVLVQRGQSVTLIASNAGMEIRAQGRALSEGSERDRVRVQNVNSLKVVEGIVENAGTVRVDL